MKKSLLAGVAVAALALGALPATAADLSNRPVYKAPVSVPTVYNWTGFYVGVSGGGAWGTSEHTFPGGTHGPFDISGGLVGGTVGYNWQSGNLVLGLEGDYSWADIHGSTTGVPPPHHPDSQDSDSHGACSLRVSVAQQICDRSR